MGGLGQPADSCGKRLVFIDHRFIRSIYFRDPNGNVIELTARTATHTQEMDPATNGAREMLDRWQAEKGLQAAR